MDRKRRKKGSKRGDQLLTALCYTKIKEGIQNFILWSDNCGGQNRNKIVLSLFIYLSAK